MPLFPRLARDAFVDAFTGDDPFGPPQPPAELRNKFERLQGQRIALFRERQRKSDLLAQLVDYLKLAPAVDLALEKLSQDLFGKLAAIIEEHLTLALREVLEQPITLKVERDFKRGAATMSFHIQRDGHEEDIMKGQGGSVANILSVGLRIFAMAQLDTKIHRRFLVLDEQDCWLAPDLVPRLVKIVHQAAEALGFQIILISHHATAAFAPYADKILRLAPTADGVQLEDVTPRVSHSD